MTRPESGPLLSPGFWLHHAALTWRAELDGRLRTLGLTHTQFMVLASASWLEHVEGPPTQQAVADHAGSDRMMTSRVIRALADAGFLERHPDPDDARAVRVAVTAAGRDVAARAVEQAQAVDRLYFGDDPADSAEMRQALRAMAGRRPAAGRTAPRSVGSTP